MDTIELVKAAKGGDRAAYGALVEKIRPRVVGVALKVTRNEADAEEVAQEVLIRGWQRIGQLRNPKYFATWLGSVAIRLASYRLRHRHKAVGEPAFESIAADDDEQRTLELIKTDAMVRNGLEQLKPADRQTLEAHYLQDRSVKQMASEFDVPVGTIKRRLHVARQRMREVLNVA